MAEPQTDSLLNSYASQAHLRIPDAHERPGRNASAALSYPIRILIVEGHPVFGEGLSTIIGSQSDMAVVAQSATSRQAISEFRRHSPDVTLTDYKLPGDARNPFLTIREEFPSARVIMFTPSEGDLVIERAVRAGAAAYLPKSAPKGDLLRIIRLVHGGRRYVPAEIAVRLAEHLGDERLTPREIEVLKLIEAGNRNKQIAGILSIAETTVNFHIRNIVGKLHANDRTHAIAIAIRRGLLDL